MENQHAKWFIEPTGDVSWSNEVLVKNLHREGCTHECSDGSPHYLFDCTDYTQAKQYWDSRHSLQISIRIWFKEGNSKPKPHKFLLTKSPIAIAVKKQVAKMVARRRQTQINQTKQQPK